MACNLEAIVTTSTLIVNAVRIPLPTSADLDQLRESIIAAIRSGGGFVQVMSMPGVQYDVCVTSGSTVIVQTSAAALSFGESIGDWSPMLELDL